MHSNPRAKVNLSLTVTGVRPDGFHELDSIFLRIGISDDLTVAFGDRGRDVLTVSGLPGCPVEGNLVLRAFAAVRRALGHDLPPLVAHLDKRIPIQAGLGGGSSDGAAALGAALQMWGAALSPQRLDELALALGSDVPFFVRNLAAARVGGRGELLEPIREAALDVGMLLVTPPIALPTAQVYARFDELGGMRGTSADPGIVGRLPDAAQELRDANDLWPAAVSLEPRLGDLRDELERWTSLPWLMSGSGSTLFAFYPSAEEAADAGQRLVADADGLLGGSLINAVNLVGPDPVWRHQWPTEP